MRWLKKGVVYKPSGDQWWAKTHAMIPTPILLDSHTLRIYLSTRDEKNIARTNYIDIDSKNPKNVRKISEKCVFDIGKPGCFDDNGVLVTSVERTSNKKLFLYYAGFELGHNIRYRLLTGLAISNDYGESFTRYSEVPILERKNSELYFRCGSFVLFDDGIYKMWYVAGSNWIEVKNKLLPIYVIKYLESADGINWSGDAKTCIDIEVEDEHGFGRPYVIKQNSRYKMFYSVRRKSFGQYRLGYAESDDGIYWQRKDEEIGLDVSQNDWDSNAIMYLSVIKVDDKIYGFYNGNNFGETGIGYAELKSW